MQYILTEEEFKAHISPQTNDQRESEAFDTEVNKMRTRYRSKELGLYNPEQFDVFIRVGSISVNPEWVSNMSDDEWDDLVNKIEAEFNEYQEPVISEQTEDKPLLNCISLYFDVDTPYLECKLSKTTIRVYPKEFEQESEVDIKKFRTIDNGSINELQLTAYQVR